MIKPKKQKIIRHTLDALLTDTLSEGDGERKFRLGEVLAMPLVFSTAPEHEVNLLSLYISKGKLYVDVGDDE